MLAQLLANCVPELKAQTCDRLFFCYFSHSNISLVNKGNQTMRRFRYSNFVSFIALGSPPSRRMWQVANMARRVRKLKRRFHFTVIEVSKWRERRGSRVYSSSWWVLLYRAFRNLLFGNSTTQSSFISMRWRSCNLVFTFKLSTARHSGKHAHSLK